MTFNITLSAITFEDLLLNHQRHCHQITSLLEINLKEKILPLFQDYLKHGFYPYWFILRDQNKFEITLEQNIHTTLEADLSSIYPHLS